MSNDTITPELIPLEVSIERHRPERRPEPVPIPSLFDEMTIRMPDRLPVVPPPTADEVQPRPYIEVLTPEDERHREQCEPVPVPDAIFEHTPIVRPSVVAHVRARLETLLGFVDALGRLLPAGESPGTVAAVRFTFKPGEGNGRLFIEGHGSSASAVVAMPVHGGREEFHAIVPLARATNVLKYLRGTCETVLIGLDEEMVHLGPIGIPFAGVAHDFPAHPPQLTGEARAVVPAHYLTELVDRLEPALSDAIGRSSSGRIHIDFAELVAVASDGERYHILKLPRMGVESRIPRVLPPAVTVDPTFLQFLAAVVDRDWAAFQIHPDQLQVCGEDYGVLVRCSMGDYEEWRSAIVRYPGHWVMDKEALLEKLLPFRDLDVPLRLRFDVHRANGTMTMATEDGDLISGSVPARRGASAPPTVDTYVAIDELVDGIEACRGGLVRLGFDDARGVSAEPITIQGEDDDFMAIIPARIP